MIREDLTGNAPNAMAEISAANGFVFQSRISRGGLTTSVKGFAGTVPQWVRLVRSGNTLSGYYSATGTTWTAMGSSNVPMAAHVYVGLALTSHNASALANATFTDATVTSTATNRAPTLTQPANQTSAEGATVSMQLVGSDPDGNPLTYSVTNLPASLTVNATTGVISGTLTFTSAGTYSVNASVSDGTLSNSKTFSWTVADVNQGPGISSLSPTSGPVGTAVTINGANFGATQGASSVKFNGTAATPTNWSAGSIVVPVPTGATTGNLIVTVNGVASNAVPFTVTTTSSLPAPWQSQDVGGPARSGQASYSAGTFSVTGAGVDIWDASDQFRFVYQTLDGDGTIIARVASLQAADPWTKAGVMIREDLTGNAPNAVAQVTSANGMIFQSRATRGATSTSIKGFAGSAPQWIRVVRAGNILSGYYSANGTTWILMGSFTVTMPTHIYVGLSVTSHNPSATATATFSDVSVSAGATSQTMASGAMEVRAPQMASSAVPGVDVSAVRSIRARTLRNYSALGELDSFTGRPSRDALRQPAVTLRQAPSLDVSPG